MLHRSHDILFVALAISQVQILPAVTPPAPSLNPTGLGFATQIVGSASAPQAVVLNNPGPMALALGSIAVTGDFAQTHTCGAVLPAASQCIINVAFKPSGAGNRTGTLRVTKGSGSSLQVIRLTGTGTSPQPVVSFSPASLIFAGQTAGTSSAIQQVTLTNAGSSALSISVVKVTGDFAQTNNCGRNLAAGAKCSLSVTFRPAATGNRAGSLSVLDSAPGSPHNVLLSGTGMVARPAVAMNPSRLVFGDQATRTSSSPQTVNLINTGSGPLSIAKVSVTGDFSSNNNCGGSLAAGATCAITVTFKPATIGSRSGVLSVADNAAGSPQSIPLNGMGIAPPPAVSLSPTSLGFNAQNVGTASTGQTVTLTNSGSGTLAIGGMAITGDFAATHACGNSLAAGVRCIITVKFAPTTGGARTGTLSLTDNAAGSPHIVSLSGTGIALQPAVVWNPTGLTFEGQANGTTSPPKPVTLRNSGSGALQINYLGATGDFAVQSGTCGTTLSPGASCTVSVTFAPTGPGLRTGTLSVSGNLASPAPTVALSGTETAGAQPDPGTGRNANLPALPATTVDTTYPVVTGQSIPVHAGGDLQTAINLANCGDEIVLDAGSVYSGNFKIPAKACSGSILIRSSSIGQLAPGKRVGPSSAAFMPALVSPNNEPVLGFAPGASRYYFSGLELTVQTGVTNLWNLVLLSAGATAVDQLPQNIVFDRVYAHGNDRYCVRGFLADAAGFALIDSYVSGFTHTGYDTQAVLAFNSPGPFLISNNYLEATGEIIMLGGGDACTLSDKGWTCTSRIPGVVPSDATITRNWFNKLYSTWNGLPATNPKFDVKNSFEVKNGQRILIDSNVFSYAWLQGQGPNAIVLTPRTGCASSGTITGSIQPTAEMCPNPQAVANDVTITRNQFQHVGGVLLGFGVDNYGYPYVTTQSARVLVRNNLGTDVSAAYGGGGFTSFGNTQDWTIDHNTVVNNPYKACGWEPSSECTTAAVFLMDVYPPSCPSFNAPGCTWVYGPANNPGLAFTNNLVYGSLSANSDNALMAYQQLPESANVSYDVWVGDNTTGYPSGAHFWSPVSADTPVVGGKACNQAYAPAECYAVNWALVGFVDFNGGNYALSPTSPYHNAASDGTDIGADIQAVLAATAGVMP
ncbi:MAG: choice-of-anchor D domain-containing protein [Bryobacteraceae bacterium]